MDNTATNENWNPGSNKFRGSIINNKQATKNIMLNREIFLSLIFASKYNPAIKLARITGALKLIKTT